MVNTVATSSVISIPCPPPAPRPFLHLRWERRREGPVVIVHVCNLLPCHAAHFICCEPSAGSHCATLDTCGELANTPVDTLNIGANDPTNPDGRQTDTGGIPADITADTCSKLANAPTDLNGRPADIAVDTFGRPIICCSAADIPQLTAVKSQLSGSLHPIHSMRISRSHRPTNHNYIHPLSSLSALQATTHSLFGINLQWIPLFGHYSWLPHIIKAKETSSRNAGCLQCSPGLLCEAYRLELLCSTVKLHYGTPTPFAFSCLPSCVFSSCSLGPLFVSVGS